MRKHHWKAGYQCIRAQGERKKPWLVFHTSRLYYEPCHRDCVGRIIYFESSAAAERRAELLNSKGVKP